MLITDSTVEVMVHFLMYISQQNDNKASFIHYFVH